MFKAEYQTPLRCHTVEELLEFPLTPKTKDVDLFLFLIDAYDIVYARLEPPFTNTTPFEQLTLKLRTFLMYNYDKLKDSIPGRLKFWTQGMFVYVVSCAAAQVAMRGATGRVLAPETREWVTSQRLRMHESWNTSNYTYSDVLRAYECLHTRWCRLEWGGAVGNYLDALTYRVAWLVSRVLPMSIADVNQVRLDRQAEETPLHPHGIYFLMAYDMQLHRSLFLRSAWPVAEHIDVLPENYWDNFFESECRHLEVRKFRDKLGDMINERLLLPCERDVTGYRNRSLEVSAYAALAEYRPLFLLDTYTKLTTYGTREKLLETQRMTDVLHLNQMAMYFQGMYNLPWLKYFMCFEHKLWKHMKNLATTTVPFVIERSGKYDVMWRNQIHTFAQRTARDAIVGWTYLLRRDCNSTAYGGIDLTPFCELMLDPPVIKEKSKAACSYQWR